MKKVLLPVLFLICWSTTAQEQGRTQISGEIQVPMEAEPGGIMVYNLASDHGTVTDDNGEFEIAVKVNDSLHISAVQYQNFTVIVDSGVVDSKVLKIAVREAVTELDEVIVRPYDLSGNVNVDVQKASVLRNPIERSSEEIASDPNNYYADQRPVENIAMQDRFLKNGLNFVNIFKAIFSSDDSGSRTVPVQKKNIEVQVRELYQDEFFQEYINVQRKNIPEFLAYAKNNGLSDELLEKGRELDLIEFLIGQGKKFKTQKQR